MDAYCGRTWKGSWTLEIVEITDMDMRTFSDLVADLIGYNNDSRSHTLKLAREQG
jgi:hypothetical protein